MRDVGLLKIFLMWALYVVIVNLFVVFLIWSGNSYLETFNLKEAVFGVWGYGWDGMHYIKIATQGYEFPLQAFFPLYPLIIRVFDLLLPLSLAYRINIFLLLVVLILFYKNHQVFGVSKKNAIKVLILFLSYPTAFFLQANYTECLYIVLALTGLLFLKKEKYWVAAFLGGLLSGVKISGFTLGLVTVFKYIFREAPVKRKFFVIFLGAISVFGLILYFAYLNYSFGSFNIYFKSQSEWFRNLFSLSNFINTNRFKWDVSIFRKSLELLSFLFLTFLAVKSYKKLDKTIWWYSVLQILIPTLSGTLLSFNRLSILAFPLILFTGEIIKSKIVYRLTVIIFSILQLTSIYYFFNNVFVG